MKIGESYELVSVTSGNITMVREVDKEEMDKLLQERDEMLTNNPLITFFKDKESLNLPALLQKVKTRMHRE